MHIPYYKLNDFCFVSIATKQKDNIICFVEKKMITF